LTAVVFVLIIMNNWDNIIEMMGMEQEIIETEGLEKLTV
jgi:hypothetical protein